MSSYKDTFVNLLVKTHFTEEKDKREYDYEGDMAMSQLKSVINNAQKLHDMLEPDTNLPEWVQLKITLAEDYIVTAANYMEGEMNEEVEQVDEAQKKLKPYHWRAEWRLGTESDVDKNNKKIFDRLAKTDPAKATAFHDNLMRMKKKDMKEEKAPPVKFPKYFAYKKAKAADVKEEVRYFSGTTVSGKPWKFTPPAEPKMLSPEFVKDRVPTLTDKEAHEVSVVAKDQYNDVDKKFAEMSEAKTGTVPKTAKEKALAAKAHPKHLITHKDVLVARGVKLGEEELREKIREKLGAPGKTLTKKPADPVVFHPLGKKKGK